MPKSFHHLINPRSRVHEERADWFNAVEGIVAETDPATLAVKVIIPSIDEDRVHDEWVEALVSWVGPDGYGPAALPEIGAEVILFSRLNEGVNLFYLARYNEDFHPPAEFADGSRGCKCDTIYRLLGELLIQIASRTAVQVEAPDVKLTGDGGGAVSVHGQGSKVGFLGASPKARQSLPAAATDLGTCIALANAMRSLLISFGLAQ